LQRLCKVCGFPLGARPNSYERDGVCGACINTEAKKKIDFKARQDWLTEYIKANKTNDEYDCVVAVSGGKDSHMIVRRLYENHGVKNALLVSVTDEFTHTKAGKHNINNLVCRYNCDLITYRCQPITFRKETLKDFKETLHPLKWIEEKIYEIPVKIAKAYGIKLIFFGENSAFEYGETDKLGIFHPGSFTEAPGKEFYYDPLPQPYGEVKLVPKHKLRDDINIIFMGAIYPYSIADSLQQAREIGFKDLDDFDEWPRQGSIEQYTQIDSVAYIIQLWTKYVKYGYQRVADIACRFVREGSMTREQARKLIDEKDYIADKAAVVDFCNTIGITRAEFWEIVAKHANPDVVEFREGSWRVKT